MIKSFPSILYDFKRSFLRLSTLLLLILFIMGGLGLSYLLYNLLYIMYPSVNATGVLWNNNGSCGFYMVLYDIRGNTIDHGSIEIYTVDNELIYSKTIESNKTYVDQNLCTIFNENTQYIIKVNTDLGNYQTPLQLRKTSINGSEIKYAYIAQSLQGTITIGSRPGEGVQQYPLQESIGTRVFPNLIVISRKTGDAKLVLLAFNINASGLNEPHLVIEYGYAEQRQVIGVNFTNISLSKLGVQQSYVGIYDLKLDPDKSFLVLKASSENFNVSSVINYSFITPVEAIYSGVLAGSPGISLFVQFFPIVFLYLSYTLMAKPRSMGALEFLLSRPVTRMDIYLTRYLAGVLTAFISTALFILGINIGNMLLLGLVFPININITLYLGITASLIVFYSLFYMISTALKPGSYLAISILLYLLFSMFWGLIVILILVVSGTSFSEYTSLQYKLAYFNPLGSASFATYYLQREYGLIQEVSSVNPVLVIVTPIIYIVAFFTIGYMIFRKTNISG